jgi:hypothetical protein
MKSVLAAMVLIGLPIWPAVFARSADAFDGVWTMEECDAAYARRYSTCTLELEQRGEVVVGRSWYRDEWEQWTCDVRGRVKDGVLDLKWMGATKYWRGTARLWVHDGGLRGEYRREDVEGTGVQYCRGARTVNRR